MKGDDIERRAVRLAESVIRMFAEPFDVRGSSFVLHASIGIALHTVANESEIDLLKKADLAMYSAKDAGKNCYQFYAPHLSHRADHLMRWEQQLRVALAEAQLFLAYQPKIDLTHRTITGFEALARWDHPEHGIISANEFISTAESTGLIVPIGDFVIRTACEQLARWRDDGHDTLTLAVNISPVQFWRGDLIETISQALQDTGIDASRLELEITETAMMEYPGAGVREDRRAEEARHPHRARRFRHRLLVAVVPAPLLRRYAEGRPLVRAGDPERSQRVRDGVVDRISRARSA
jgi:predicted signal transduction protein with EAL and GGDEF domain